MKIRLSQFLTSAFILPAALLGTNSPARADRPWRTVQTPAMIIGEYSLDQPLATTVTSLPDGSPFTLGNTGRLYRLDPVDGRLSSLSDELPPLTALTANAQGLWAVAQAPKPELLNIAPDTGVILNHVSISDALVVGSHISALQVTDDKAFLMDDGAPAFVVVDLKSGHIQRLLEGVPSLSGHNVLIRHGKPVTSADGRKETGGNVRFLALSHNREWLFYQAPTGPLYRIGTGLLTDPGLGPAERIEGMANWRRTPSLGGLTIDGHDTLYMVDIDHGDLLAFGADRLPLRLLHDDRLYGAQALALLKGNAGRPRRLAVLLAPVSPGANASDASADASADASTAANTPASTANTSNTRAEQQPAGTQDGTPASGQPAPATAEGAAPEAGAVPLPADNHSHLLEITLP